MDDGRQRHLLGENGLLRRVIESGSIPNLIFYGPSGVGKTTVASIIAQQTDRKLYHLNATTAGIADIKAIIDEWTPSFLRRTVRLCTLMRSSISTKSSSRACLEFIETGKITLIASTTENPYFYIYNAIFKPLHGIRVQAGRGCRYAPGSGTCVETCDGRGREAGRGRRRIIAQAVGGTMRKALGAVELLVSGAGADGITLADAQQAAQRSNMRYDRDGDSHYDILSALQKSVRGSDPDAALHYLSRGCSRQAI